MVDGVFEVTEREDAARSVDFDGDQVDAPVIVGQVVLVEIGLGGGDEFFSLCGGDGFFGDAEGRGAAGLHFDEEDDVLVLGDDVHLAPLGAVVGVEDAAAEAEESLAGQPFAQTS